jgi:hypothetical protein
MLQIANRPRAARKKQQRLGPVEFRVLNRLGNCCFFFLISLSGCGGIPGAVQVEGKVTAGGQPLTTGYVIFYPDPDKGNLSQEEPRAEIDTQGNYQLLTGIEPGVKPGWYKVAVTAADQIDPNNPYFTNWLIPEKYIDPRTSGLALEVVENPPPGAYDLKLDARSK